MPNPKTPLTRATDPASTRLTLDDIVAIHKAHNRGEPWGSIADRYNTTWKNVSRIVQGLRWSDYHPMNRPDLYEEPATTTDLRLSELADQLAAAEAALRESRRLLDEITQRGTSPGQ